MSEYTVWSDTFDQPLKPLIFHLPCLVLQEYLRSLGNIDCNPQNYLEIKSQQKFMIIIQNEDIAAHVHKVTNNSPLQTFFFVKYYY